MRGGEKHLSTNRIADIAGFSIGTLYQYFPNKEAILIAMAEREIKRTAEAIKTLVQEAAITHQPTPIVIRQIVRVAVKAFSGRYKLRRLIVFSIMRSPAAIAKLHAIGDFGIFLRDMTAHAPADIRLLSDTELFVVSRAVIGAIRAAVMEDSPLLNTPQFEDAMVQLIYSYIKAK